MLPFKHFFKKNKHNSIKKNLFSSNIYNDKRIRDLMFNVLYIMFNLIVCIFMKSKPQQKHNKHLCPQGKLNLLLVVLRP